MKITVCIGSSCHIKGSRLVVQQLQTLIEENNLQDKVSLNGTFCMGRCQKEVSVSVDEELYSLTPENTKEFFEKYVLSRV
ncbi:MAG: (2Fe-2S) ferredoxin domain-containing protein [Clostridia bacterium]|nr:(2Fe-2S) ferredoxin domain-containing protein [Clostridia bacterium]MBR2397701.1 (2Fe-2S) ferredoxin domain-containing protein [Clostridia bacterium]MBR2874233.1 (2Fe-2S) ferredoxin domain-containing protein [Clostridia bacterium]